MKMHHRDLHKSSAQCLEIKVKFRIKSKWQKGISIHLVEEIMPKYTGLYN